MHNLDKQEFCTSRDVVFYENILPFATQSEPNGATLNPTGNEPVVEPQCNTPSDTDERSLPSGDDQQQEVESNIEPNSQGREKET